MKNLKTGFMIAILIAVIIVIAFIIGNNKGYDKGLNEQKWLTDSVIAINNEIPDTVFSSDTVWNEKLVYKEIYRPVPSDVIGDTSLYQDTIKTEDLDLFINDVILGEIISRKVGYNLKIPKYIRDTVKVFKPIARIIRVPEIVKVDYKAFLSGSIGVDIYSISYNRIIKENYSIGARMTILNRKVYPGVTASYFFKK